MIRPTFVASLLRSCAVLLLIAQIVNAGLRLRDEARVAACLDQGRQVRAFELEHLATFDRGLPLPQSPTLSNGASAPMPEGEDWVVLRRVLGDTLRVELEVAETRGGFELTVVCPVRGGSRRFIASERDGLTEVR